MAFHEPNTDKLIQPLIERQQRIDQEIIEIIAKRIAKTKEIIPSDVYRLQRLYETGTDVRKINDKLSELTDFSLGEIQNIIKETAYGAYEAAKPFYDYRELPFTPFEQNEELQKALEAIERVTLADYTNLSNSTGFALRDPSNLRIIHQTPASKAYQEVIDRAVQSALTDAGSYNTLIPKAIQDLTQRGLRTVDYTTEKGRKHSVRLDTVVRRNILDAIRNVQQTVQDITGEQFGADGVELSVHIYSAPDHEPIQGHMFSDTEFDKLQSGLDFKDVNGQKFKGIDRPIGMWNCRHFARRIIIEDNIPVYTPEQLEDIKRKNANGITIKNREGKDVKKSMYWCTQKQREYELELRKAKEGAAMANIAGETKLEKEYDAKVVELKDSYKAFCNRCGLKPRFDKTRIYI